MNLKHLLNLLLFDVFLTVHHELTIC